MSANLKALGLALLAALALSALAAGPASAEEQFHAAKENTEEPVSHVILDAVSEGVQTFHTPEEQKVDCEELSIEATTEEATVNTLTVAPEYSNCEVSDPVSGSFAAHVEFGECHYDFTSVEVEDHEPGEKHAPVHIQCPEGQEIHVKATFLGFKIQCMTIPKQTPTEGGVKYNNIKTPEGETEFDAIEVEATVTGITYTLHTNCGGEGEPYETKHDATYEGKAKVWGTNTLEKKVDIWWE